MDCEAARELHVEALVAAESPPGDVERHLTGCEACRQEVHSLSAAWSALAALPAVDPSPLLARRLGRRIRLGAARETLASVESWQRAALAGVAGFVVSVLLSFLVPYQTMVALCERIASDSLPGPLAYALAGVLYGLVPMMVGARVPGSAAAPSQMLGGLEAALVFVVVLIPWVLLRCGEFPPALLGGFVGGIALGAAAGGMTGVALRRGHAWA